jgi:hypothetical protein
MLDKDQLKDAFADKILAVRNYPSAQDEFGVEDFVEIAKLEKILDEIMSSESDLTPAGKVFLEKYYPGKNLAIMLFERSSLTSFKQPSTVEDIHNWLIGIVPMEIITIIEESRGTIKKGQPLKPELLPPENI